MPKNTKETKIKPKGEVFADDEKLIEPDLVVPATADEDSPEEPEENEEAFADDDLDPFHDKFEE